MAFYSGAFYKVFYGKVVQEPELVDLSFLYFKLDDPSSQAYRDGMRTVACTELRHYASHVRFRGFLVE